MTGFGSLIWIFLIVALVFFMMRKGGWCFGSDDEHKHDHDANKEQSRGGCCG